METLSVRDFRSNMAASFNKASHSENVLIRRKNEIYALVKVGREELMMTPELQRRIEEVHQVHREGKCVTCSTHEELEALLESL